MSWHKDGPGGGRGYHHGNLKEALIKAALSHGIASLFARGDDARRPIPMTAEELLEAGALIHLGGLGAPPGGG